jgi:hypothetical protein
MRTRLSRYLIASAVSLMAATPVFCQGTSLTFAYTLADGNVHALANGATINFPSVNVGSTTTATVSIVNAGSSAASVTGLSVTGTGFTLYNPTLLPATVGTNQTLQFAIIFAPTQAGTSTGAFSINTLGTSISGTLSGSTPAPAFSVYYSDPATNNILSLPDGSTLPFTDTLVGNYSTIALLVSNSGIGTGSIKGVTLDNGKAGFQIVSLAPLPLTVGPSQQTTFGIRFTPQQAQSASDTLHIDCGSQTFAINLQAKGIATQYTYGWSNGTGSGSFPPGGTLALTDTAVGQATSVVITVSNAGTSASQISNIGVTGQGLSVSDLPALPVTLRAGASEHFTVTFAPTQPGVISGRLTVGNDTFTVSVTGVGPKLVYSYSSASSTVPVSEGGVVVFPPLSVGGTEKLSLSIQNTGTSAATISTISLAASNTIFTLSGLPSLPTKLDVGSTITFSVGFAPNNTGSLSTSLLVNASTFTLSGSGTEPAALPSYQFQGPSGNQQPAQQPTVGLTLAAPYPAALQGSLKLTFTSSVFTDDPSIQFATGSRTVNFTIPANSTQALFGSATTVPLQTGTTAGTILITPSFAMSSGFDMTPTSPATLSLNVQKAAPQLLTAVVSSESATSFTVTITGYSTTRAMKQFNVQISPKQGQNISGTSLTIDAGSAASAWFQSATSQSFGGSFLVTIPFALSNGSSTDDLVHMLQSLSITATNDVGASNAVTVTIP